MSPRPVVSGRSSSTKRISSLDFIKGVLVLVMVLYHWMNYFVQGQAFYRYLRFLTPSFIFITGFITTQIYLSRYEISGSNLSRRLIHRGLKILAIFVVLNAGRSLLVERSISLSSAALIGTYVTGNIPEGNEKAAAFNILVPISYLLFLLSLLLVLARRWKYIVPAVCLLLFISVLVLNSFGSKSGYVELLSLGLLGASVGYVPMRKIESLAKYRLVITAGYLCYLGALSVWGEVYVLQVIGVCLSLAVIYLLHGADGGSDRIRQNIALLGRYSLIGYIGQIAILQAIRFGVREIRLDVIGQSVALVAAILLTLLMVWIVDQLRAKAVGVDRVYVALFG
jgi:hypothetical protein